MSDVDAPLAVTVRTTASLSDGDRRDVIDLCIAAHELDGFEQLFELIPPDGLHVLGHRGGELVSHAVVTTRWAQPDGEPVLHTGYVDAVSTRPDLQGRHYGSAVMTRLAATIADHELGCLQTDRVAFYERLGWELWRGPLAGRSDHGLVPTPEQAGVMVLRTPRSPRLDLDALLSIECQPNRIWE